MYVVISESLLCYIETPLGDNNNYNKYIQYWLIPIALVAHDVRYVIWYRH